MNSDTQKGKAINQLLISGLIISDVKNYLNNQSLVICINFTIFLNILIKYPLGQGDSSKKVLRIIISTINNRFCPI